MGRGRPNSPNNLKRNRYSCARKKVYRTMAQALSIADEMERKHCCAFNAYVCGACGLPHVGRVPNLRRAV